MYLLGIITSDYYFSAELDEKGEKYLGYNDTRDVKWFGEIPRDRLNGSTKSSLGASTTLFNINKNARKNVLDTYRKVHNDEYDISAKIIRNYLDENNSGDFEQEVLKMQ